jgi:hypothetical protein
MKLFEVFKGFVVQLAAWESIDFNFWPSTSPEDYPWFET